MVDPQTGQDVVLSDKDIDLIQRMLAHKNPDPNFEEYPVSVKGVVLFSWKLIYYCNINLSLQCNNSHKIKIDKSFNNYNL